MRKGKYRPIPREEPPDDESIGGPPPEASARADGPITVRPPPEEPPHPSGNIPSAASYANLRNSCRAAPVDEPQIDDELAIEAEVLRLAMDRSSGKKTR